MTEDWLSKRQREAAEVITELLKMPIAEALDVQDANDFDPWQTFNLYGTYDSGFDECAINVLESLLNNEPGPTDLASEMFREMLCNLSLCEYGTSPRTCWPTPEFKKILPDYLGKWKAYSAVQWA